MHRQEALKLMQRTADRCWEAYRTESDRFLQIQHKLAVWYYSGVGVDGEGGKKEQEIRGVDELERFLNLFVKKTSKHCELCHQVKKDEFAGKLLKCGKCGVVRYCSEDHQILDHKQHKRLCPLIRGWSSAAQGGLRCSCNVCRLAGANEVVLGWSSGA